MPNTRAPKPLRRPYLRQIAHVPDRSAPGMPRHRSRHGARGALQRRQHLGHLLGDRRITGAWMAMPVFEARPSGAGTSTAMQNRPGRNSSRSSA
jgi:hypothetical protein